MDLNQAIQLFNLIEFLGCKWQECFDGSVSDATGHSSSNMQNHYYISIDDIEAIRIASILEAEICNKVPVAYNEVLISFKLGSLLNRLGE